ncbi:ANTAR domain-containing protein [Modestobacter lapidis]|nr:ANTAR domain-containing protein [Modestobacter lapidis]
MTAHCTSAPAGVPVQAALPEDVVRTPTGAPAVLLVRTSRGWSVLSASPAAAEPLTEVHEPLPLVEAMSLADLVSEESGATPEPGRPARLAARGAGGTVAPAEAVDPRDAELASLRRTVGQLEHALAARVSIERAIGVLAERHGTCPREAFEELRRRARAQGRPAQELAREVLDGVPALGALPDQRTAGDDLPAPVTPEHPAAPRAPTARRVSRGRARQAVTPGSEAEGLS